MRSPILFAIAVVSVTAFFGCSEGETPPGDARSDTEIAQDGASDTQQDGATDSVSDGASDAVADALPDGAPDSASAEASTDGDAASTYACGDKRCTFLESCQKTIGGQPSSTPSYQCNALPGACATAPTCESCYAADGGAQPQGHMTCSKIDGALFLNLALP